MNEVMQAAGEHETRAGEFHDAANGGAIGRCVAVLRAFFAHGLGVKRALRALDEGVRQQLSAVAAQMDRTTAQANYVDVAQADGGLHRRGVAALAIERDETHERPEVTAQLPVRAGHFAITAIKSGLWPRSYGSIAKLP
jgi:hypothetical protein